jgi:predicted TPR repeat methyltransferase
MWQRRNDRLLYFLTVVFYYCFGLVVSASTSSDVSLVDDILSQADDLLRHGQIEQAIGVYRNGIHVARQQQQQEAATAAAVQNNENANDANDVDASQSLTVLLLSLYTNLGTALSSLQTEKDNHAAVESYQSALQLYDERYSHDKTFHLPAADQAQRSAATSIAASAAFYLGMVYQDLPVGQQHHYAEAAIESYSWALTLDGNHWAAAANRGSVQQDILKDYRSALASYNLAYGILTRNDDDDNDAPTDPPEELPVVLSQLQYRIGLCITYYGDATTTTTTPNKKCVVQDDPDQRLVDCRELATHAFALAVQYDAHNELAKHMLASITTDASMVRASNAYVTALFDEYATSFEHSLVHELRYNGFERLRRGFDRAMEENGPTNVNTKLFDTVLDAGCGTGLAGEQFRNVSRTLIGVDLSRAILDQAVSQRPGLYDEVIAGDVIQAFHDKARSLSLIIAADSFIYFGNLDPLLAAMYIGLTNDGGGLAAFTLENVNVDDEHILASTKNDWRWQLTASGRFAHRKDYVVKAAQQHGFAVEYYEPLHGTYVLCDSYIGSACMCVYVYLQHSTHSQFKIQISDAKAALVFVDTCLCSKS